MQLRQMCPFVRYARTLALNSQSCYPVSIPCDARLFYTREGSGVIFVEGQPQMMKKGSVLVINSGIKYQIRPPEKTVTYLVLNFDFTMDCAHISLPVVPATEQNYLPEKRICYTVFSDEPELNRCLYVPEAEEIRENAEKIIEEYKGKLPGFEPAAGSLLTGILVTLLRKSKKSIRTETCTAEQVIRYVRENFASPLSNASLARKFGFHPNYLSSVIKNHVGMPLHRYVLHLRILRSMELLEAGYGNISWVARQCGFCDVYYFSRYFKSVMNMSPRDFLNNR